MTPSANSPDSGLAALDQRRSVPVRQLGEPGPDEAALLRMLRSAVRVPDHGKRVPYRFIRIQGDARDALGQSLAEITLQRNANAGEAEVDKDKRRFSHAPLVIAVLDPHDTHIPEQERLLTAGCVCFALLQAAQAMGFGACWLSGWPAYDARVRALLGVEENERVAGFIHIGTPQALVPERERPDPAALLTDFAP